VNILVPLEQAWSREKRLETMRRAIVAIVLHGDLSKLISSKIAAAYRLLEAEIDAEKMRHLSEGIEGK
jgi:hypothetical protein